MKSGMMADIDLPKRLSLIGKMKYASKVIVSHNAISMSSLE